MEGLNWKDGLVLVYDAPDQTTAEIVCATLQAAGIQARLQNQNRGLAAGMLPYLSLADGRGVLVAASDAPAARALLDAQQPTEEELTAEAEADTTTLEEAEDHLR